LSWTKEDSLDCVFGSRMVEFDEGRFIGLCVGQNPLWILE